MRCLGDDRSEVTQPMHFLDIDPGLRREFPCGADVWDQVAGRERSPSAVVNIHPVGCRRRKLVPVERGESPQDHRPCVRVGVRFAREVPGIELGDGSVEVVEVEGDPGSDPMVGVDLE